MASPDDQPSPAPLPAESSADRRRAPRAEIAVPLSYKVGSVEEAVDGEAINVSESGMFIIMENPVSEGTVFDVHLELKSGELLLHAEAEVVRCHRHPAPAGVGVRFRKVSFEAEALLKRVVADTRLFGDYKLERVLGRGGMAEVYKARCLTGDIAGQQVAIKRILPSLAGDDDYRQLMLAEGDLLKTLVDPRIVQIYEVGEVGDSVYMAMELVEGCDLQHIVDACSATNMFIPVDFACFVVETVAHALHFAHTAPGPDGEPLGIVHRDVGPSNVFISSVGEVKLGDFGVAQTKGMTDDYIVGKDPFMSPEHIRGDRTGPAADVFALGATLYLLLTNRLPYIGDTSEETWKLIEKGEATEAKELRPEISDELNELVMSSIAPRIEGKKQALLSRLLKRPKDERKRFANAGHMADAIANIYDSSIGTPLGIASVVRHVLKREAAMP